MTELQWVFLALLLVEAAAIVILVWATRYHNRNRVTTQIEQEYVRMYDGLTCDCDGDCTCQCPPRQFKVERDDTL